MAKVNEKRLVVNRVNETIVCYNADGDFIALFPAGDHPIPDYHPEIAYIVDNKEYQQIKATGKRPTKDLVHVAGKKINGETGRSGVNFSYLESFEEKANEKDGKKLKITPYWITKYRENDPKHLFHELLNM